jgi:hypothetical protein
MREKEKSEPTEKWSDKWSGNRQRDEKCTVTIVMKLVPITLNTKSAKELIIKLTT